MSNYLTDQELANAETRAAAGVDVDHASVLRLVAEVKRARRLVPEPIAYIVTVDESGRETRKPLLTPDQIAGRESIWVVGAAEAVSPAGRAGDDCPTPCPPADPASGT